MKSSAARRNEEAEGVVQAAQERVESQLGKLWEGAVKTSVREKRKSCRRSKRGRKAAERQTERESCQRSNEGRKAAERQVEREGCQRSNGGGKVVERQGEKGESPEKRQEQRKERQR